MLFGIILVLGFFGFIVLVGVALSSKGEQNLEANALANAEQTYTELFDGRQQVTYEAGAGALPLDAVVAAADERGYEVTSTSPHPNQYMNRTVVTFKRRQEP